MKYIFLLLLVGNPNFVLKTDVCPTPNGCNPCLKEKYYINPVLTEENTDLFCCPENQNCLCINLIN